MNYIIKNYISRAGEINLNLFCNNRNLPSPIYKLQNYHRSMSNSALECSIPELHQYCECMIDYCEITNDWSEWITWALRILRSGHRNISSIICDGLGRYFEEIEDFQTSLKYHKLGIQKAKNNPADMKGLALNCLGLGITLSRLNNRNALTFLLLAKQKFRKLNNYYYLGCTNSNIGGLYLRFEKKTRSIYYFILAIFQHRLNSYMWDLGRIYYSLACVFLVLKSPLWKFSNWILKKSLNYNSYHTTKLNQIRYGALSIYAMGRFFYRSKEYEKAMKYLQTAYSFYDANFLKTNMYSENQFNICYWIAKTNIKINNMTIAKEYLMKLYSLLENSTATKTPVSEIKKQNLLKRIIEIKESIEAITK